MQPGQPDDTHQANPAPHPGQPPATAAGRPDPVTSRQPAGTSAPDAGFSSNLGASIAMFVLFPPFALPAVIDARRAAAAYQAGDQAAADDAANESRRWSRIALIFGLAGWALLTCCGGSGYVLHSCGVIG